MAVWLCECGAVHTETEKECNKCESKQKETLFLGLTVPSSVGIVTDLADIIQWAATVNFPGVGNGLVTADAQKEIQWKARVECKNSTCAKKIWVDWDKRHETKCFLCQSKMEYTGHRDKK